ncbi:MAG: CDP-alcohol phosphatidyltransferase family protein [Actinomycetota bacterium]
MTRVKLAREEFFRNWSALHGGAVIKGIVRVWLTISFTICRFLAKVRITPNGLTYISLVFAGFYLYYIDSNWAIAFLVLSLMADGLDGTLAIITQRVTRWGAALDSVVDRIVETLWAIGLFQLGAPWQFILTAWLAAFAQEYMRARAGGLGIYEIGVVTISERPVRATFIFIALVGRVFDLDIVDVVSGVWMAMQVFSALTVLKVLRSLLQQSQR